VNDDDRNAQDRIEHALSRLTADLDELAVVAALRRTLPQELARRGAELWSLRQRAKARFPSGKLRFLTRKGLEQATREVVAHERALRFAQRVPGTVVYDATCGLGSDALALSLAGLRVLACDLDVETARNARDNLAASSTPHCVFVADADSPPIRAANLMIDPDRRADSAAPSRHRNVDAERWSPSTHAVAALLERCENACIKLPPGFDIGACPVAWVRDRAHSWQWVSAGRELCEVNLWLGALATSKDGEDAVHEVVAIAAGGATYRWSAGPTEVVSLAEREVSEIAWLADPDPALVRSQRLGAFAVECGLAPLDAQCAYLGGARRPDSPLVDAWRVVDQCQADARTVRRMLTSRGVGPIQVHKRGHPETSEALERRFAGGGSRRGVLFVARLEHGHRAFLVEPAEPRSC